jgi:hypothetical protein
VISQGKLQPVGDLAVTDKHCLVYRPTLRETVAGQMLIRAIKEASY